MKNLALITFKRKRTLISAITLWVTNIAVSFSSYFFLKSRILKITAILLILFTALSVAAQPAIPLNNIKKIILERKLGLEGFYRLQLQLVPVRGEWKCYQSRLAHYDDKTGKMIEDTAKKFLKNIPVADLSKLVSAIAASDTAATFRSLHLDSNKMLSKINSIRPELMPVQKTEVIEALNDQKNIATAFYTFASSPNPNFNEQYKITLITKDDLRVELQSSWYTRFYNMPWQVNNKISLYNRDITTAFYAIFNPEYLQYKEASIEADLAENIYFHKFSLRFAWDDFKTQYPSSYALLHDTLTPRYFSFNKNKCKAGLRSLKLPEYVVIDVIFAPADTKALRQVKRFEDTVAGFFKTDNFLFRYIRAKPGRYVGFAPGKDERYRIKLLQELTRLYPSVPASRYTGAQLIDVSGPGESVSHWLLLPDNKLLLWEVWGQSTGNGTLKYMGRTFTNVPTFMGDDDDKAFYSTFIIFDAWGNIIKRSFPIDRYAQ